MEDINVLDYKIEVNRDDEGDYIAIMPELGCIADGTTIEEAINELKEVAADFIKLAKEDGKMIPRPKRHEEEINYSGKLSLRIPKSLHKIISIQAEKEGCSINQLITMYISMGAGNEFGKNHLSVNLDVDSPLFQNLIRKPWKGYEPPQENRLFDLGMGSTVSDFTLD